MKAPSWAVGLVVILVLGYFVYPPFQSAVNNALANFGSGLGNQPGNTYTATTTATAQAPGAGLQLQFQVKDKMGAALTANTLVDIIMQSDLSQSGNRENLAIAAAAQASVKFYGIGEALYFHVYSTNGNRYYDSWFKGTVGIGNHITQLVPDLPACTTTTATWHEEDIGTIGLSGNPGAVQVYTLPTMMLKQQTTAANTNFNIQTPTGTSMNSGTGTAVVAGGAYSGTGASNYTAAGTQSSFKVVVSLGSVSTVWGEPMLTISSSLPYTLQARYATLWFAINTTAIVQSFTQASGWCTTGIQAPGYTTFFRYVGAVESTQTDTGFGTWSLPIQTVTAGQVYGVGIWIRNLQLPTDVAQGTNSAAPTAYGAVTAYGIVATIQASGYSLNASNVPQTYTIHFRYTSA